MPMGESSTDTPRCRDLQARRRADVRQAGSPARSGHRYCLVLSEDPAHNPADLAESAVAGDRLEEVGHQVGVPATRFLEALEARLGAGAIALRPHPAQALNVPALALRIELEHGDRGDLIAHVLVHAHKDALAPIHFLLIAVRRNGP